MGGGVGVVAAQ